MYASAEPKNAKSSGFGTQAFLSTLPSVIDTFRPLSSFFLNATEVKAMGIL